MGFGSAHVARCALCLPAIARPGPDSCRGLTADCVRSRPPVRTTSGSPTAAVRAAENDSRQRRDYQPAGADRIADSAPRPRVDPARVAESSPPSATRCARNSRRQHRPSHATAASAPATSLRRLTPQHLLEVTTALSPHLMLLTRLTTRTDGTARQARSVASAAKDQATSAMRCGGNGLSGAVVASACLGGRNDSRSSYRRGSPPPIVKPRSAPRALRRGRRFAVGALVRPRSVALRRSRQHGRTARTRAAPCRCR